MEPLNPAICVQDPCEPFYLFESSALMVIGSSILERITPESAKGLAKIKRLDDFPYCETSGEILCPHVVGNIY